VHRKPRWYSELYASGQTGVVTAIAIMQALYAVELPNEIAE